MQALDKAGGFLRYELAQRMDLRVVPELRFHWDPTLAYAEEVDRILGEICRFRPPKTAHRRGRKASAD